MRKKYVAPAACDIFSEQLMWTDENGMVHTTTGGTQDHETGSGESSKRNVFVFDDDSSLLPTVSMDD